MRKCGLIFFLALSALSSLGYSSEDRLVRQVRIDHECRALMKKLGEKIASEQHLTLLISGLGVMSDAKQAHWAFLFTSNRPTTIEEARPLAQNIICQMINLIYTDSHFADYFIDGHLQINPERVAFRLDFWDEEVNRPLFPYLAEVRLANGKVYYHYADPATQALQEPIVEPVSELVTFSPDVQK